MEEHDEHSHHHVTHHHKSGELSGEDKVFAALAYVSILFIVPLILRHDHDEVYFHARQGMVLFGAEVVVWFVLFLLDSFLAVILPVWSFGIMSMLQTVSWLVFMAISVAAIAFVFMGKRWMIPVLGGIAKKIEV